MQNSIGYVREKLAINGCRAGGVNSRLTGTAILFALALMLAGPSGAQESKHGEIRPGDPVQAWDAELQSWVTPEQFWLNYANSRGGLSWGSGKEYPPYAEVEEHDTFIVVLSSGSCLMEFFHSRWRRANDVQRWDDAFNEYSACPHVFD